MPADNGSPGSRLHELCVRAQAARRRSLLLARQVREIKDNTAETLQLTQAVQERAGQAHQLRSGSPGSDRLRYPPYARLQARVASMPVIEQAKGIIMAHCGWPEGQAFEALRRVSQRENVKIRDLAAQIVAEAVRSSSTQWQTSSQQSLRDISVQLTAVGDGSPR